MFYRVVGEESDASRFMLVPRSKMARMVGLVAFMMMEARMREYLNAQK